MLRLVYVMFCLVILFIPIVLISPIPFKYRVKANLVIYKLLARAMRVRISVRGKIVSKHPILFASNHMSYADIVVLGSVLPGNFISKADVKKWPFFGWIAVLTGTVFVNRKKSEAGNHLDTIDEALNNGKNLILLPEGTTSDGKEVLPFKTSLFKIAEKRNDITVQPVTLSYTHINGLPLQTNERVKVAWVGDSELLPHLTEFVNLGIIRAEVKIHPPITVTGDRKLIAAEAHKIVADWKN